MYLQPHFHHGGDGDAVGDGLINARIADIRTTRLHGNKRKQARPTMTPSGGAGTHMRALINDPFVNETNSPGSMQSNTLVCVRACR
jgi:hypothetical protein